MDLTVLPERLRKILGRYNLGDSADILTTSVAKLKRMSLTDDEIHIVKLAASKCHFHSFKSATRCISEMRKHWMRITFGCPALDAITRNGIATRGITEICGESGSGKSQICLQLALTVQLAEEMGGLGKGAVFICTEDAFPSNRLYQVAATFSERFGSIAQCSDLLDNIYIEHISECDELLVCVSSRLPQLMAQRPIGLIIIDSVGAIFRLESDAIARAVDLRRLALDLQKLNTEFGCGIICINQVTSVVDNSIANINKLIPCLGLAWSNLVTARFQIHRTTDGSLYHSIDEDGRQTECPLTVREFEIIFSPNLPSVKAKFLISPEGIVDVPE